MNRRIGILLISLFVTIIAEGAVHSSSNHVEFLPIILGDRCHRHTSWCVTPTLTPTSASTPTPGEVPTASQPCPSWVHDRYVVIGPDGQTYPTWHPPVDPEFGCFFGHEHGADPRTSQANMFMPAFGYAALLGGMHEPHEGFKVFVINHGTVGEDGNPSPNDHRIVFHMGTSGVGRYVTEFHSLQYDLISHDGTGREAHIYGMADTGPTSLNGSTCDNPRRGAKDFSDITCGDTYEIWPIDFRIEHPDDPYTDVQHVRLAVGGAVAVFNPITTRDPNDNTHVIYSQDFYYPSGHIDPLSTDAYFTGCAREAYGGPNYWDNPDGPTEYWTDPMGHVKPGPGPGLILQHVSQTDSRLNDAFKYRQDVCGNGIHSPN